MATYRVGNHQPQNLYRDDTYIGVMFSPIDAAAVVRHLNMGLGECTCESYEPCAGECCGVGMCSCSATSEEIAHAEEGLGQRQPTPTDAAWHWLWLMPDLDERLTGMPAVYRQAVEGAVHRVLQERRRGFLHPDEPGGEG